MSSFTGIFQKFSQLYRDTYFKEQLWTAASDGMNKRNLFIEALLLDYFLKLIAQLYTISVVKIFSRFPVIWFLGTKAQSMLMTLKRKFLRKK